MKKLITILFLFNVAYAQMGANISVGTDINLGIQYKNFEVQGARKLSNLSIYPSYTLNANYHYGILYAGYGTEGLSYGVRLQKKQYILSVGRYGNYNNISLGVSSLPKRKVLNLFSRNEWAIIGLQFVSGFSSGLHEAIQARHWGNGKQFWDNQLSWKNKYKADGSERFPGSTTIFVAATDGYHLTYFISNSCNVATLAVSIHGNNTWKDVIKKVAISVVTNRVAFYLSYNQIFK